MNIIVKCSYCNKDVRLDAYSCPNCGAVLDKQRTSEETKKFLSWIVVVISTFVSLIVFKESVIFGFVMLIGIALIAPPIKNLLTEKYPANRRIITVAGLLLIFIGFIGGSQVGIEKEQALNGNLEQEQIEESTPSANVEETVLQGTEESVQPETITKDYSNIVYKITKKGFPKTYDNWGKKWIDDINTMMPLAVQRVASNSLCDEPIDVDLSDNRSTIKKEAVFYVDCANGERFYISQNELSNTTKIQAESDVLSGVPSQYIEPCREMIKAQLNQPSSFNADIGVNSFKGTSGNMVVEINFTAKDTLGIEQPHSARCVFGTNGENEAVIIDR